MGMIERKNNFIASQSENIRFFMNYINNLLDAHSADKNSGQCIVIQHDFRKRMIKQ